MSLQLSASLSRLPKTHDELCSLIFPSDFHCSFQASACYHSFRGSVQLAAVVRTMGPALFWALMCMTSFLSFMAGVVVAICFMRHIPPQAPQAVVATTAAGDVDVDTGCSKVPVQGQTETAPSPPPWLGLNQLRKSKRNNSKTKAIFWKSGSGKLHLLQSCACRNGDGSLAFCIWHTELGCTCRSCRVVSHVLGIGGTWCSLAPLAEMHMLCTSCALLTFLFTTAYERRACAQPAGPPGQPRRLLFHRSGDCATTLILCVQTLLLGSCTEQRPESLSEPSITVVSLRVSRYRVSGYL